MLQIAKEESLQKFPYMVISGKSDFLPNGLVLTNTNAYSF
jgi:hypothetical protein